MANTSALAPLQLQQFSHEELQTPEGVANLNQFLSILTQRVNAIGPSTGSAAEFPGGIDLSGARAVNVGGTGPQHTAISFYEAEQRYSAAAISPQLEAGQPNSPKSLRRVNDGNQQERYSTFLKAVMNTAPTSNTSVVTASGFTATISAGYHQFLDGSLTSYGMRSDTLTASPAVTIVSLTRASGVVTAVTSGPSGLAPTDVFLVAGATDPTFDGSFTVATIISSTSFTYPQAGIDAMTTGGTFTTGRIFYYFLARGSRVLSLSPPVATDTQSNRVAVNQDGTVLIAVVAVTGAGVDLTHSTAGATPPSVTGGIRITNRL
jgi:hypothetical protein